MREIMGRWLLTSSLLPPSEIPLPPSTPSSLTLHHVMRGKFRDNLCALHVTTHTHDSPAGVRYVNR